MEIQMRIVSHRLVLVSEHLHQLLALFGEIVETLGGGASLEEVGCLKQPWAIAPPHSSLSSISAS